MSTSDNKAVVRRLYEEFVNQGDEGVFDDLVAADVVEHEEFPGLTPNREGILQFFAMMRTAFPDLHFAVDDLVAEDDKVVGRFRMQGTHQGEFIGAQPTGNRIEVPAIDVFRLSDGKIKEHWGVTDTLSLTQQLGAAPS